MELLAADESGRVVNLGLVICGLIGHSRLATSFFGYQYCARCSTQVGDNLAGIGQGGLVFIDKGHVPDCDHCKRAREGWPLPTRLLAAIEEPILRRIAS